MEDELINPPTISTMSQEEIESLLISIRERRSRAVKIRNSAHSRSRNVSSGDLSIKLERLASKLDKNITKIDKLLNTVEHLANEVVALRIQHGDGAPEDIMKELAA